MKTCSKCGLEKDIETGFYKRKGRPAGTSWCRACWGNHRREYQATPEGVLASRKGWLKFRFEITPEEWDARFKAQGKQCALCFASVPRGGRWHTDHNRSCCPGDKSCGKCICGIVCHKCNLGIGHFNDDACIAALAAEYLGKTR